MRVVSSIAFSQVLAADGLCCGELSVGRSIKPVVMPPLRPIALIRCSPSKLKVARTNSVSRLPEKFQHLR